MVGKELPVLFKRKEECCGCTACYAACPRSAITMTADEEGFEYPQVDEKKCVRCYICLTVCLGQGGVRKKSGTLSGKKSKVPLRLRPDDADSFQA